MKEKTVIEVENENLQYNRTTQESLLNFDVYYIVLIFFTILFLSILLCFLQNFNWAPLKTLETYKRIKKNNNSWFNIIKEKIGIEVVKGRMAYLNNPNISKMSCIDFGDYYSVGKISENTFLPEFIKRGNSGPWIIKKADKNDPTAEQFCNFVLNKYNTSSNIITCGTNMYKKLGYSGYFIPNSPCERILNII